MGTAQVYVVPPGTIVAAEGVPFVGDTLNAFPLQMVAVCAAIAGTGFTLTMMVNGLPTHAPAAPEVGVTVYVAVCTVLVGFTSVWLIEVCDVCALEPVIPPVTTGAGHVYVVFVGTIVAAVGTPSVGLTENAVPLQIAGFWFAMTGFGLTVTVTVNVAPTHDPAAPEVGVTV
jgi:hypothetical protein